MKRKIFTDWDSIPLLCTPREAAQVIRTSERTFRDLIRRGLIKSIKLVPSGSSRLLVRKEELQRLVNDLEV